MNACPRCSGRLFPDRDGELSCMSCGNTIYPDPPLEGPLPRLSHHASRDRQREKAEQARLEGYATAGRSKSRRGRRDG